MNSELEFDVFISYRWVSPDQDWVRNSLVPALQAAGLKTLLDVEDFLPGRDLVLEMTRAGQSSRMALCIISPEYFEDDRMVNFEALAARRKDPSGQHSILIPFLLRKTELPEWIRGLVPVDWTDPDSHSREWSKLLHVLNAPNPDALPPMPVFTVPPLKTTTEEQAMSKRVIQNEYSKTNSRGAPRRFKNNEVIIGAVISAIAVVIAAMISIIPSLNNTGPDISSDSDPDEMPGLKPDTENNGHKMILIRGGEFEMGSPEDEAGRHMNEGPQHTVNVKDFMLSAYPVTNEKYGLFLKANPMVSHPKYWNNKKYNQPQQPVVGVSWEEAKKYCEWAGLRLPTEAEWEFACRAGTSTRFYSGDSASDLERVAWYRENSGNDGTHSVGEKDVPNDFGLYDIHGNVQEWVEDDYHTTYEGATRNGSAWINEPERSAKKVIRSCSFRDTPMQCRSAARRGEDPSTRYFNLGFRPAKNVIADKSQ